MTAPPVPASCALSRSQVTQEVTTPHPVAASKKASKVSSDGSTAEPKSSTAAELGDSSAAALALKQPTRLTRSVSQPTERSAATATRKVTLFESCTTTTLESSNSSLSTEDGNDSGEEREGGAVLARKRVTKNRCFSFLVTRT